MPPLVFETRKRILEAFPAGIIKPEHTEYEHWYRHTVNNKLYASSTTKIGVLSKPYKQWAVDQGINLIEANLESIRDGSASIAELFARARRAHSDRLTEAGTIGTGGHGLVEDWITVWIRSGTRPPRPEYKPESDPREYAVLLSCIKFCTEFDIFPVVSEILVFSDKHNYAGTLDAVFYVGETYKGREGAGAGTKNCAHEWWGSGKNPKRQDCTRCSRGITLKLTLGDWKSSNSILGSGKFAKHDYALQVASYHQALVEHTGLKIDQDWIVRLSKERPEYEIGVIEDWRAAFKAFKALDYPFTYTRHVAMPIVPYLEKSKIVI